MAIIVWTKEKCHEIALKYSDRMDFHNNDKNAANAASYHGWYKDITSHMPKKTRLIWNYDRCKELALKCKSRGEFSKTAPGAYAISLQKGWLEALCTHMSPPRKIKTGNEKPSGYWTYERCQEEALKYSNKKEFRNNSYGCYQMAQKKGWLDTTTPHFDILGNVRFRFVYAYEFDDNHVYVGLTGNIKIRQEQHMRGANGSQVYNHIKNTNANYVFKVITPIPLSKDIVGQKETDVLNEYKKNGWAILNKQKTGGLGGCNVYWTKERCIELAKQYDSKKALNEANPTAYKTIYLNKWGEEAFQHTKKFRKDNGYWTYDRCRELAIKYKTLSEFRENDSAAYNATYINGWMADMAKEMNYDVKLPGYWTYDRCKEEALKYDNINLFKANSRGAQAMIYKNKWFELVDHIKRIDRHERNYWTYERCKEEAKKYVNKRKMQAGTPAAYHASRKNKWIDEFFPK